MTDQKIMHDFLSEIENERLSKSSGGELIVCVDDVTEDGKPISLPIRKRIYAALNEIERLNCELSRLSEVRMSDKSIWVYKEKNKLKPYFSSDGGAPSNAYVQYVPAAELERVKTECKALKGNWAGTWINEGELNDLVSERDRLKLLAVSDRALLKKIEAFLDTDIAILPCESRVRTMSEETWETAMYLRDLISQALAELGGEK